MGLWDIILVPTRKEIGTLPSGILPTMPEWFTESAAIGMLKQVQAFELFKQGTQRKIKNLYNRPEMDPEDIYV
ncbi:MAG: hypothetical protein IPI90_12640 [Saprospiraceae bacterium]|nr:hypothetical protein [Candidatus Vicinibacter affinis]